MSGIAAAAPMSVNVSVPPGGEFPNGDAGVTVNNGSYSISGLAGQDNLLVTPAGSSTGSLLQVYCTDIYDYLSLPATFTAGLLSDTLHDATRISRINALLANGNHLVHDAATSAGLQFAIWEVEYETSGVYDVTSGNLTVTTDNAAAIAAATADLHNLADGSWQPIPADQVVQLEAPNNQTLVYLDPSAVAEPASFAVLGFGLLGLAGMRRRAQA